MRTPGGYSHMCEITKVNKVAEKAAKISFDMMKNNASY